VDIRSKLEKKLRSDFVIKDNVLYKVLPKPRSPLQSQLTIVVPKHLQQVLLPTYHDSVYHGHLGISKTFHKMKHHIWWPGMKDDVGQYVNACMTCQQVKGFKTEVPSYLPTRGDGPFLRVAMDLFGPFLQRQRETNTS